MSHLPPTLEGLTVRWARSPTVAIPEWLLPNLERRDWLRRNNYPHSFQVGTEALKVSVDVCTCENVCMIASVFSIEMKESV